MSEVKLYMAPMEEISGYVFRNVQHALFGGADKFFSPFITPTESMKLKPREKKDICNENNKGIILVPQLLTNEAELFIKGVKLLNDMGYEEVNLNLGCPSNTVAKKGKGSGFLLYPDKLDSFFDTVFSAIDDEKNKVKISVKTRLGYENPDEFIDILPIFNRYNISELIVHPRVKTDMYGNEVREQLFEYAYKESKAKVCYNGDICTKADFDRINAKYPDANVMIGRGAVANPGIFREIRTGRKINKDELLNFNSTLFSAYSDLYGRKDAFFKLKEVWNNMSHMFDCERLTHKIKISKTPEEMLELIESVIIEENIIR